MKKFLIGIPFFLSISTLVFCYPLSSVSAQCPEDAYCVDSGDGWWECSDPNCQVIWDGAVCIGCQDPPCGAPGNACCEEEPVCNLAEYECIDGYCVNQGTGAPSGDEICQTSGEYGIDTAIGCIPTSSTQALVGFILVRGAGIAGGIAFILIVAAGIMYITSGGDPKRVQAAKELLTAAVSGLLLLIFGVFILEFIGVDILNIPGFGK